MTSQTSEILLLDDRFELLHSLPLDPYLELRRIDIRAFSGGYCTGLYRGYAGLWEVFNDSLFLVGLLDIYDDPIDPEKVFGDLRLPILADWYCGRLEVDRGECLYRAHRGWGGQYAERLRLHVEHGHVVARRRYDQRKVLLRRFNAQFKEYEDFRQQIAEHGSSPIGPLGGYTAAGLKVIGQPPFEQGEPWPDGMTDQEIAAWVEPRLAHCVRPGRPGASAPSLGAER